MNSHPYLRAYMAGISVPTQGWWRSYLTPEPNGTSDGGGNSGEGKGRPWWSAFSLNGRRAPGKFPDLPHPHRTERGGVSRPPGVTPATNQERAVLGLRRARKSS